MKKQISPTIKAHLIRGAFYLILLLAVCAIPFALAQSRSRGTTRRGVANAASNPNISNLAAAPVAPRAGQATKRGVPGLPRLSSAAQGHRRVAKIAARLLHPLIPDSVYMLDDGTAEDGVGFGNGAQNFESLWMNHFDVISGQTMISTVSVAWGTPFFPDPSNNGTAVTIAIWSDPNGDGDPTDGVLLGSVAGTIQNEGTDTFVDYTFNPPVDVSAFTSFFVGDMTPMNNGPEHFYQGIDETPPSQMRSWIAANGDGSPVDINNVGNNDTIGTIDSFGLPGNWLIRADTGQAASPTPTPTGTPATCSNYMFITGTDPLVPGNTDTGNHTDDGDTFVALPFSFQLYDQTFNGVNVNSNGRLDFVCINEPIGQMTACLPAPANQCPYDYTIFGMWQDMRTDAQAGCASFPGGTCGIFTSVSGSAPNRIFNIEWRSVYFATPTATANFEVRLYENDPNKRFDVIYGVVQPGGDHSYVGGVQGPGGAFTQDFCDVNPPAAGSRAYTCAGGGGSPTPTPTASPSCTPIVVNGSIDTSDPTQTDRLFRSGIPQTCPASTTCAIFGDGLPRHYDEYTFTNTTGATQCVTIDTNTACTGANSILIGAYLGSFNPANICTNWIGDSGRSPNPDQAFQVDVDNGQMLVVVVSEVTPGAGCPSYTMTMTGLCGGGTPTPTPTSTPTCTAAGGTPEPWTQATPVGIDHYGGFMDSDGSVAYEGGGYSFSAADNINEFGSFDPVANTWMSLAPVPDLNNAEASGVYAPNVNKLFVFGGEEITFATVVNTTRIYDIATNTWSTGGPMPDVRAFMASGYFNGKIYLVGGYSTGNVDPSFGQVWEYDPVTNTFNTSRTSMPATLGGAGFGVINGHIYVAGGRDINNTNLNTLYDYDIAAGTWTQRANLPTGVNVPGSAVIGGKLWVFGGGNPFVGSAGMGLTGKKGVRVPDTTNILQIYDPVSDSWTNGPSLSQQRSFPAGTHVGNTAVAVGGYDGSNTLTSVEINVTSGGCQSPTPSATATATPTPTFTPCTGRCTPTPRPRPTPGPRPTP